jgi:small subunit ribosomal protein S18
MGKNTTKKKKDNQKEAVDALKKFRKKPCHFCATDSVWIDYKDIELLRRYMSDRAKIRARRVTGNCTQHQAEVANAIKVARELALLPYLARPVSDRSRRQSEQQVRSSDVRDEEHDDMDHEDLDDNEPDEVEQ